jgi:REP element-mobilizing transposase RayT
MEDVPYRKQMRLPGYDYSQKDCYYITICTQNRRNILCEVVGGDALIAPSVHLSEYGKIVDKYVKNIDIKYKNVQLSKYVVMPNHIHMIILLTNGAMRASPPTISIPDIIRSLKKMISKETGVSLFQESYYDHIIRDEADYLVKWNYIDTNPVRWKDDEYYTL